MAFDPQAAMRLIAVGDLAGAARLLEAALVASPGDIGALNMLAGVRGRSGDGAGALALLEEAARRAPQAAPIHFNRAVQLAALGRPEEAVAAFTRALELRPGHAESHLGRAGALLTLARHAEALADFERARKLGAAFSVDAIYNRGRCLQALDRLSEALAAYEQALALRADADVQHNHAVVLQWLGRRDESLATFDAALALRPDHAATLYSKAVALLAFGDYADGWTLHETRGAARAVRDHTRNEPRWRGERLDGALRIWPEQGVGDELLFARLAPLARARTDRVILECNARLAPLFARSLPGIETCVLDAAPPAGAQIAAGSLGAVLNAGVGDLGGGAAFLMADVAQRDALRARYAALAQGRPIIGIAWISKNPELGAHKSTSLMDWAALLKREALFVNLQYGDVRAEIETASRALGVTIHTDESVDQMRDLDAFAAQIAAMDQIVSVSNTTVHLAGALGVPCMVVAPPAQGLLWYWGANGDRTPWYESVRVVRRVEGESWADQVARAAALLA